MKRGNTKLLLWPHEQYILTRTKIRNLNADEVKYEMLVINGLHTKSEFFKGCFFS
jgi:hypothetical protein